MSPSPRAFAVSLFLVICFLVSMPSALAQEQCPTPTLTLTLHAPTGEQGWEHYSYSLTHDGNYVDVSWRGHTTRISETEIDHSPLDSGCMAATETLTVTSYKSCGSSTTDTEVATRLDTTPKIDVNVETGPYTTQFGVNFRFFHAGNGTLSATFLAASGAIRPLLHEVVPPGGGRSFPGQSEGGTLIVEGVSCVNQVTTVTASGGTGGSCSITSKACPDCVGKPVHTMSGNMRYEDADPIAGFSPLPFVRNYDSQSLYNGHFGDRWSSIFDAVLASYTGITGSEYVNIRTEGGDQYVYQSSGGAYVQLIPKRGRADRAGSLVKDTSGSWIHTDPDGRTARVFSAGGVPIAYRDVRTGREVQLSWQGGAPSGVSDSWGAWSYTVTVDASERIQTVVLVGDATQTWTYTYSQNMLVQVDSPEGQWRRYVYEYIPVNGTFSPLTEAYDGADHLIEKHTYDLALARSSLQATDDITAILPLLAGRNSSESLTKVIYKTGREELHYKRLVAGEWRTVEIDGGCSSCGSRTTTTAFDDAGNLLRTQNSDGYISRDEHDSIGRVIRTTTAMRPVGCDPETAADRCRQTADTLPDVPLQETPESVITEYSFTDANWPERPTVMRTRSVAQPGEWRTLTFTFDALTGDTLTSSSSGWSGSPATLQTRTTTVTLYAIGEAAAFDPGDVFQASWAALPQPRGMRKSIDGPRSDVADIETLVYYPVDAAVPGTLRGRLAARRNAAGHIARFTAYDLHGNVTAMVDPNGVRQTMIYDAIGRMTQSTTEPVAGCDTSADPLCATALTTIRDYSGAGPLLSETRPGGGVTRYEYDELGRLKTISRGPSATDLRERIAYQYDPNTGRKSRESTSAYEAGSWVEKTFTSYTYDTFGRVKEVVHPDASKIVYTYAADHIESVKDENHAAANTNYAYDAQGRVKEVRQLLATAPGGEVVTQYGYDRSGNLTSVTDPNGNVTTYVYDDFGQMLSQTSPVTGATTYAYDAAGQLLSSVDSNGAVTARTYDPLGRPLTSTASRTGVSPETTTWSYDDTSRPHSIGRLSAMTDSAGVVEYSYTRMGQLRLESREFSSGQTAVTAFTYDADGNRSTLRYPSGAVATYAHDFAGRPYSVSVGAQSIVSDTKYAPFGGPTQVTFGNGTTRSIAYDSRLRIQSNQLSTVSGVLAHYTYGHDPKGNITSITDQVDPAYNRTFQYDDLDRLITANSGAALWGTGTFAYDPMGNLLSATLGGTSRNFTYDSTTPKLTVVTENGVPRAIQYDSAGNEIAVGAEEAQYSARNHLASDGRKVYQYDGRGVRAAAQFPSYYLESIELQRSTLYPNETIIGTVHLGDAAPAGGAVVQVSSSTPLVAVPSSVTVPAGASTATFEVSKAGQGTGTFTITGDYGFTRSVTGELAAGPSLVSVILSATNVTGGSATTATVTLDAGAPPGGATIVLTSSSTAADVPESLTIPEGQVSGSFAVTTSSVASTETASISATYETSISAALVIEPVLVESITIAPASVSGGRTAVGTIVLNGPTPASGVTVSLGSSHAAVSVPATISVLAGSTEATFFIATLTSVTTTTSVTITATYGVSRTAILEITPCVPAIADAPALPGTDVVWVEDGPPAGSTKYSTTTWDTTQKASGASSMTRPAGVGEIPVGFLNATSTLSIAPGDNLVFYVLINECKPPRRIMLEMATTANTYHYGIWGEPRTGYVTIGSLPAAGQWTRIEVPARLFNLEYKTVKGMMFYVTDGQAWFDQMGKRTPSCALPAAAPAIPSGDRVWIDDAFPAGSPTPQSTIWDSTQKASGSVSYTRPAQAGVLAMTVDAAATPMLVGYGESLVFYALLSECAPPRSLWVTWKATDGTYRGRIWGEPQFGEPSAGLLPTAGSWTRFAIPASDLNMEFREIKEFRVATWDGQVWIDHVAVGSPSCSPATAPAPSVSPTEVVWTEDEVPAGATSYVGTLWDASQKASGTHAMTRNPATGEHALGFNGASAPLSIASGENLVFYLLPNECVPPRRVEAEWLTSNGTAHRAVWGEPRAGHLNVGPLPTGGQWARLEVPAHLLNLEYNTITGVYFYVTDGQAWFDRLGKNTPACAVEAAAPAIPASDRVWIEDSFPSGSPTPQYVIWDTSQKASGTASYTRPAQAGYAVMTVEDAAERMSAAYGESLVFYALLSECATPRTLWVTWKATDGTYRGRMWGEPQLGESSSGPLPVAGVWTRYEIPASQLGLEFKEISEFKVTAWDGQVWIDHVAVGAASCYPADVDAPSLPSGDTVWVDDGLPSGATLYVGSQWDTSRKASGAQSLTRTPQSGQTTIAFSGASPGFAVEPGDTMVFYVAPNECARPSRILVEWHTAVGNSHWALWGEPLAGYVTYGLVPANGEWTRMEVAASSLGLENKTVTAMGFYVTDGQAWFDRIGTSTTAPAPAAAPVALGVTTRLIESETSGSVLHYSIYSPELQLLANTRPEATTSAFTHEYVWFGGVPVAQMDVATGNVDWYFTDHLGTPLLQTDASANIVWRAEHEPYGKVHTYRAGATKFQPLRFPGQENDGEGETSYNIYRWYRAGWGRYTQADPAGLAAGLNLYAYALGNPNSLVDPLGAEPKFPQFPPSTTDDCSADEWKYCEGKCGSKPVVGCYVTITHKLKTVKGFPQFGIQRTVNCNCKEDDCEKSWPDKLKDWWKEFTDPNKPPLPPLIPIPPKLPTPKPVIPGLPPFFINPCMLNPSLCDDGTGIA